MRFFDNALDAFKASLARTGLLDESIVVVFGDHDAGFPRDRDLARAIGIGSDEASWMLNDRIPLVIRVPHPSDPPDPRDRPGLRDPSDLRDLKGSRAVPAGQTDFAPTLLALLGIDAAPLPYVGRNLLGVANGPVVRPYGGWIDRDHLFLTSGASAGTCFEIAGRRATDLSVCRDSDAAARHARETSRLVVADDLQQRMRTR
jgi:lipoteichoic acid synthase